MLELKKIQHFVDSLMFVWYFQGFSAVASIVMGDFARIQLGCGKSDKT